MPATPAEPDDAAPSEGFATLMLPMGGLGTPRLPLPADPLAALPADAQLVRLRDVVIGGQSIPAYETGAA